LIGGILKKCPIDEGFVERVLESGCVRALAEAAVEVKGEAVYRGAFEFAEALATVKWADDFGTWSRPAVAWHGTPAAADAAAAYLLVVSRRLEGVALLREAGVIDTLTQNRASFPAAVRQIVENFHLC
jgi:hypothetical protein